MAVQFQNSEARLPQSHLDRKWDELSAILHKDVGIFQSEAHRRKLVIFSEHRDTLKYFGGEAQCLHRPRQRRRDRPWLDAREERRNALEKFTKDKETVIFLATDAGGEGINLHRGHLMVNYDLPWNPNRIEQRFGRIHRIGQTEVRHL